MRLISILVFGALAFGADAFGQGTILFNTRVPGIVDAPVAAGGSRVGPEFGAQLLAGRGGSFTPLLPITRFRSGADVGYVEPVVVTVPFFPPGAQVDVVMIFFLGQSRETAIQGCVGQGPPVRITLGGNEPAYLTGMQSVEMIGACPEPSSSVMLVCGALGLLYLLAAKKRFCIGLAGAGAQNADTAADAAGRCEVSRLS